MFSSRIWREFLSRLLTSLRSTPARKRLTHAFRPTLKQLEERTVPAVYNVNITSGGQSGQTVATLSAAISLADSNSDASNIVNLGAGSYTSTDLNIVAPPNKVLTIIGQASGVTITAYSQDRVFTIDANVTFVNLTITGGRVAGGGAQGTSAMGGGLLIGSGQVALSNVNVSGNQVQGGSGSSGAVGASSIAMKKGGAGGAASGGGVYLANGSLTLINSTVSHNEVIGGPGGPGAPGTTNLSGGTGGAGGAASGGGIFVASGNLTLTNSSITFNKAVAGKGGAGGGSDASVGYDRGRGGEGGIGAGGGVFLQGGNAVFRSAAFRKNAASGGPGGSGRGSSAIGDTGGGGRGGALYVSGSAQVNGFSGSFDSNTALAGGGGNGAPMYQNGHGGAGQGGGVFLASGVLNLVNTSLDKNHAKGGKGHGEFGGGFSGQSFAGGGSGAGGAFYQQAGSAKIYGASIAGNSAVGGNGSNGTSEADMQGSTGGDTTGGGVYLGSGALLICSAALTGDSAIGGQGGSGYVGSGGSGGSGANGGYAAGGAVFVAAANYSLVFNLVDSALSSDLAQGGAGGAGIVGGTGGQALGGGIFAASKSPNLVGTEEVNIDGGSVSGSAVGGAGGQTIGVLGFNGGSSGGEALGGGVSEAQYQGQLNGFTASAAPDVYTDAAAISGAVRGGAGGSRGPAGQAQSPTSYGSEFPLDVQATHLVLSPTLPSVFADAASPDPIYVIAEDAAGNVDPNFDAPVSLGLLNGPGNPAGDAQLAGTLTVSAIGGVAQFSGLDVANSGAASNANQYEVRATSIGGLASAPSNLFTVNGYSPALIRTAYGLNNLPLDAQGQPFDGTGQTIAIIVTYDDPNLLQDVDNFDQQFGLTSTGPSLRSQYGPASSFLTVLNQYGQPSPLPGEDPTGPSPSGSNWAGDESLDVEMVHSIAPGANIVVIECASPNSLAAAAAVAASLPNVSVASMSFGAPETTSDLSDNNLFTTLSGHIGVTFLAASGNTGSVGAQYPAFSSNVIAVGGTTLSLTSQGGIQNEAGWKESGGGASVNEPEPTYQDGVQSTGFRTIPDVAAIADPTTGAAIVDSFNQPAGDSLEIGGGTDLATPLWAGLIALVNQGRVAEGNPTLNSSSDPTQALSALYSVPASDFNSNLGGGNGTTTTGLTNPSQYNEVTGLGSPAAIGLIPDLIAYGSALSLTPASLPGSTIAANYSRSITYAGGVGSVTLSESITSGSVPAGLTLNLNGNTLSISGKPTATGAVDFEVTATDSNNNVYTQYYTLTVNSAITLAPGGPTLSAVAGLNYSQTISALGGTGVKSVTVTNGSLPPGIAATSLNNELELSGEPTTPGIYVFTATAMDAAGASTAVSYTFTVNATAATPSITRVSPSAGPTTGGTTVTITGTNLANAVAVYFGVNPAAIVSDAANQLVVTSPASGPGTVNVTVTTAGGTSTISAADAFAYLPAPIVGSVAPAQGPLTGGAEVTVTGANLEGVTAVYFGTALATSFFEDSNNVIEAYAPPAAAAGPVDVTVVTVNGTSQTNAGDQFTYVAAPVVAGVSPSSGSTLGFDEVAISGMNLAGASEVDFGYTAVTSFVSDTATQIVLYSPAGVSGTVDVTVDTSGGDSTPTVADEFTYGSGAAPTVGYISPGVGPIAGGTTVNIFGSNFTPDSSVMFGDAPATDVTVVSSTQITAVAPPQGAMASLVDVTVTNSQGTSPTNYNDQFVYQGAPTVTSVSPNAGPLNGHVYVVITGTNLLGPIAVDFNQTPAIWFYDQSATEIDAYAPAGMGIEDITVTTSSGTSMISPADEFTFQGPPTVSGVSPSSGSTSGGDQVTITGTNLQNAAAVYFGGASLTSFVSDTPSQIVLDSPAGAAGTIDVTVVAAGGASVATTADEFTYGAGAAPTVGFLSTSNGPTTGGTEVTIYGSNFTPGSTVSFGDSPATSVTVVNSTEITAVSPAQGAMAAAVDVTVTNASGTSSTSPNDQFTYQALPSVTNVSPAVGPLGGGTGVIITGTNLENTVAVYLGIVPAEYFYDESPTEIEAYSPPGTGTVDILVTTAAGTSAASSADHFTYQAAPTVTGLSPSAGPLSGGEQITISGANLENTTEVDFGAVPITTFVSDSPTQIVLDIPASTAGTVDVTVDTPGGTSTRAPADRFTYSPVPVVTGISPAAGATTGGTYVLVTGTNLANASAVTFGSAGKGVIVSDSATQLLVESPQGSAALVDVTVTTPGGVSATTNADQFAYIAPPTVAALSPATDSTAGGTAITITGTNLQHAIAVQFGSTVVTSFISDSGTQLVVDDPAEAAGTVDVVVVTPVGQSPTSAADVFTYGVGATPTVFSIAPAAGLFGGGSAVTITGQYFTATSAAMFGDTAASSIMVVSSTEIIATAPAQGLMSSTVDVTVTTAAGTSATSPADKFVYASPATSFVSLSAPHVLSGASVVVTLQAEDAAGHDLPEGGLTVAFQTSGGAGSGTFSSVTDNGNGTYTAIFTGTTLGSTTITATIDGQAVTTTAPSIQVVSPAASLSLSTVSIASGTDQSGTADVVTLQARDALGDDLATGGLTVTFGLGGGAGQGTFSSVTDNRNGTYSAAFTGTLAGSNTITATIGGNPVTSTAPSISVTPGVVSLAQSIVELASSSVQSGSTDVVTLQVEDAAGNKLTGGGLAVAFLLGSGAGSGTFSSVSDNHNGTYSATFTAVTAGSNTVTATINSQALTSTAPAITITPGPVSLAKSVVTLATSSVQSGDTDAITLQAEDANGNKLTSGGLTVAFALGSPSGGQGTITNETDNGDGTYTATFSGTLEGSNTITATINEISVTSTAPSITVAPGPVSPGKSTVTVGTSSIQSGSSTTVAVKPEDAEGNALVSPTISFALGGSRGATGSFGSIVDNGDGTYSSTFVGILAGRNQIVVTVNGTRLNVVPVSVTPGAVDPANSVLTLAPANIQFGGTTRITVRERDAAGNNETVGGAQVVAVALGSTTTGAKGTLSKVTNNDNGSYTATFTGTADGSNTIIATIGGATVGAGGQPVAVSLDAYSSTRSTLKLSVASGASGSPITITFQAEDAKGTKEIGGGLPVMFKLASARGGQGMISPVIDNGNGTYTATFTGTIAGANTIKVYVAGRAATAAAAVKVTPGPISLAKSTISLSTASVKAGGVVTVTLHAKDAAGNSLTTGGLVVAFSVGSGTGKGTFSSPVKDNKNGTYSATFTGGTAGTNSITATIGAQPVTSTPPPITVLIGAASGAKSTLTATGPTVQAGSSISITLKAIDLENNALTTGGLKVAFGLASLHGARGTFGPVKDNKNGTYTVSFTGTLAGTNSIYATIGGVKVTTSAPAITVTPGLVNAKKSVVTLSAPSVNLLNSVTVTFQAKDAYGNDVDESDLIVAFALASTSGGQGSFGAVTYSGNGAYTASFTGTKAGVNSIKATMNQAPVTSTAPTIKVLPMS